MSLVGCFPDGSEVKNPPASVEDTGSIPRLERFPGKRNGNPLQYSCLGNPMDRGGWRATVHGIAKSQTQLSIGPTILQTHLFHLSIHPYLFMSHHLYIYPSLQVPIQKSDIEFSFFQKLKFSSNKQKTHFQKYCFNYSSIRLTE